MATMASVVLAGLESSGKSSIFRGLSRGKTGDESNFRGSTVMVRKCYLPEFECNLLDTPGIRTQSDSTTTRLAIAQIDSSDTVLLVARGTHVQSELGVIFQELKETLENKRVAIAITFEDKAPSGIYKAAEHYQENLGIPVVVLNARSLSENNRNQLVDIIRQAKKFNNIEPILSAPEGISTVAPQTTWFEHRMLGPFLALLSLLAFFAVPVMAAYYLASWIQPIADEALITPLKDSMQGLPILIQAILIGDYGVVTLGWYSFLWAFPVVAFIGLSVGLLDETGFKDRITAALDPWLRSIGLSGRDLIPVLTGYGCNVVAVFQSRSCGECSRKSCISMIAFGSACSYQIGASLSLFGSSGNPWLFMPYLAVLFFVGAVHTRIWYGAIPEDQSTSLNERAFLQKPSLKALFWKFRAVIEQFLFQAMPIFLIICAVAALLQFWGVLDVLSSVVSPVTRLFMLPADTTPAIIFSILRKDGLLVLNQGEGVILQSLSVGQVFVLVYLASTLTACLVTLGTIYKETGAANAIRLASRQAITSIISALLIVSIIHVF